MLETLIEKLKMGNMMEKLMIASSPEMRKAIEIFMENEDVKNIDLG